VKTPTADLRARTETTANTPTAASAAIHGEPAPKHDDAKERGGNEVAMTPRENFFFFS